MDFGIKTYNIYFYTSPASGNVIAPTATIFLYDTSDVFRGQLDFYPTPTPDLLPIQSSYDPGSQTFLAVMDYSALAGVLGALQLNVPCTIKGYDLPRPELHTGRVQAGYRPPVRGLAEAMSSAIARVRGSD